MCGPELKIKQISWILKSKYHVILEVFNAGKIVFVARAEEFWFYNGIFRDETGQGREEEAV